MKIYLVVGESTWWDEQNYWISCATYAREQAVVLANKYNQELHTKGWHSSDDVKHTIHLDKDEFSFPDPQMQYEHINTTWGASYDVIETELT